MTSVECTDPPPASSCSPAAKMLDTPEKSEAKILDTPQKAEARRRTLIVLRYVQRSAGPARLSDIVNWIKAHYSLDALYESDLYGWSRSATRVFATAQRDLIKDVVPADFDSARDKFLKEKAMVLEAEELVELAEWKNFRKDAERLRARKLTRRLAALDAEAVSSVPPSTPSPGENSITTVVPLREQPTSSGCSGGSADEIASEVDALRTNADVDVTGAATSESPMVPNSMAACDYDAWLPQLKSVDGDRLSATESAVPVLSSAAQNCLCGKRKAEEWRNPPKYTKKPRPELPQRQLLESDITFSFRILTYLQSIGVIAKEQNARCRKIVSDELARGLVCSLMEFAVENDEQKVADAIGAVAPRPASFVTRVLAAGKDELRRTTMRAATMGVLKAVSYVALAAGTTIVMKAKELI